MLNIYPTTQPQSQASQSQQSMLLSSSFRSGSTVKEICLQYGCSKQSFSQWRKAENDIRVNMRSASKREESQKRCHLPAMQNTKRGKEGPARKSARMSHPTQRWSPGEIILLIVRHLRKTKKIKFLNITAMSAKLFQVQHPFNICTPTGFMCTQTCSKYQTK